MVLDSLRYWVEQTNAIFMCSRHSKGCKRHIVVDVLGLILAVAVTGANVQDRDGGQLVLKGLKARFPRLARGVGGWSIRWSTCGMGGEDGSVCAR